MNRVSRVVRVVVSDSRRSWIAAADLAGFISPAIHALAARWSSSVLRGFPSEECRISETCDLRKPVVHIVVDSG